MERTRHDKWQLWRAMNLNNLGLLRARLDDHEGASDLPRAPWRRARLGDSASPSPTSANRGF